MTDLLSEDSGLFLFRTGLIPLFIDKNYPGMKRRKFVVFVLRAGTADAVGRIIRGLLCCDIWNERGVVEWPQSRRGRILLFT